MATGQRLTTVTPSAAAVFTTLLLGACEKKGAGTGNQAQVQPAANPPTASVSRPS